MTDAISAELIHPGKERYQFVFFFSLFLLLAVRASIELKWIWSDQMGSAHWTELTFLVQKTTKLTTYALLTYTTVTLKYSITYWSSPFLSFSYLQYVHQMSSNEQCAIAKKTENAQNHQKNKEETDPNERLCSIVTLLLISNKFTNYNRNSLSHRSFLIEKSVLICF